ncbi:MAG: hypothetical protein PHS56_04435 [Eubacteriales bacterium]|nr:hypothetical protein [Eubacteriales bacterium]
MKRLAVFVALLLFLAGCSGAQPTQAETTIPEIIGITFVIDGQKQAIKEGKVYQLGNRQYFDLQVSDNVTEVEFLFVPDYADQSQALLSGGTKIADGVYRIEGDYFLSGQGYSLVYSHNIAVRSGRFSLSTPSC